MGKLVPLVLGAAFGVCVQAQEVRGRVFELKEGARVPSAGAFVIVHWTGRRPGMAHYESVCIQAAVGRTDAQGRFEIAEPPPLRSTFLVFRNEPAVAVYKPGFDERSELGVRGAVREAWLAPTRLDAGQRAAFVELLRGLGCRDDQANLIPLTDPQGALLLFQEALAAESSSREKPR
jgi:hypothetical protein